MKIGYNNSIKEEKYPEIKTLCWPDEIDFDPDELYYKATGEPFPEWMNFC